MRKLILASVFCLISAGSQCAELKYFQLGWTTREGVIDTLAAWKALPQDPRGDQLRLSTKILVETNAKPWTCASSMAEFRTNKREAEQDLKSMDRAVEPQAIALNRANGAMHAVLALRAFEGSVNACRDEAMRACRQIRADSDLGEMCAALKPE